MEAQRERRLRTERRDQRPAGQAPGEDSHCSAGQAEHGDPKEHRPLVVPPRSGDLVDERLRAVAVRSDQQYGKVGSREDHEEHRESEQA
jgi:hypothetical protein